MRFILFLIYTRLTRTERKVDAVLDLILADLDGASDEDLRRLRETLRRSRRTLARAVREAS